MNKNWKLILYAINLAIMAVLATLVIRYRNKVSHQKELFKSLEDTVISWKGKNGELHSEISNLKFNTPAEFLNLKSRDEQIKNLQKEVQIYKSKLKKGGTLIRTEKIMKFDTIKIIDDKNITFSDSIKNKWIESHIDVKNGKMNYSLNVEDKSTIVVGMKSRGWFKSPILTTEIKDENPYIRNNSLRTVVFEDKRPFIRIRPTVYTGYGATFSKGSPIFGYQVGVGLSLNFKN